MSNVSVRVVIARHCAEVSSTWTSVRELNPSADHLHTLEATTNTIPCADKFAHVCLSPESSTLGQ
jgi:hypothetical protein